MTRVVAKIQPVYFSVAELPDYLRERTVGEIPAMVIDELQHLGYSGENIDSADTCIEGVQHAVERVTAGDLLMLVGLDQQEEILAFLEGLKK